MNKRLVSLGFSKKFLLIILTVILCFVLLTFSQSWMISRAKIEKKEQTLALLELIKITTDSSLEQALKLSQLLLLDNSINKFVYQKQIAKGSPDIQTIIDAKRALPIAKTINIMLEEIYIYSRASEYLLSSNNAYMDIQTMYPSLLRVKDLNYGQWKTQYLDTNKTTFFYPSTFSFINGREKEVIPFIQTFPLNNPSSNVGKIIFLLNKEYFSSILLKQDIGENGVTTIIDENLVPIITHGNLIGNINYELEDGQYIKSIDGEKYIISVVSSDVSTLRFYSILALKDINATLNPLWTILSISTILAFLIISLGSLYLLYRNHKQWKSLFTLVTEDGKDLQYEQAVSVIQSIVETDRNRARQSGSLPFITDSFFRRLIYGRIVSHSDIEAMLYQIHKDIDFTSIKAFRMLHIFPQHDIDNYSNETLKDLDFCRIVGVRQTQEIFGRNSYLYMDLSFSLWIMIWSDDEEKMKNQVGNFWSQFTHLVPISFSLSLSSIKLQLDEIPSATHECIEVTEYMKGNENGSLVVSYEDIVSSKGPYYYPPSLEKQIVIAVVQGEVEDVKRTLSVIEDENFSKRTLSSSQVEQLLGALKVSAAKITQTMNSHEQYQDIDNFEAIKEFFITLATSIRTINLNKDELLKEKIVHYIEENFRDYALNLSHMGKAFSMKESFLYHFMNTRMNTSFAQYVETFRLEKAIIFFSERQRTIGEVATMCGYTNNQTFRRAFKKHYGVLPSEYQKTILYQ